MKRSLLLAVAAAAALCASADASVKWLGPVHDFGAIAEDNGPASCTFRYVNTGDEPLVVTAARANCGCTTPRYDKHPTAPGDTAEIAVSYDPGGRAGRFSKKIFIDMNTVPARSTLEVKGTVIGTPATLSGRYPVELPGGLRLRGDIAAFGPVAKGRSKTIFFEAYNQSADTLRPVWLALPRWLTVVARPAAVPPGEQATYALTLNTADTPLYGLISDSTRLCLGPQCADIALVALVNEDFTRLTPGQLMKAPEIFLPDGPTVNLGTVGAEGAAVTFPVKNRGRSPLLLRRVYSADPGVSVSADRDKIKPGKTALVTVSVAPDAPRGDILSARVQIIANDPASPVTNVRVTAVADDRENN